MSAEKKSAETSAEAPKKSRKLLIIVVLGVVVLGGGGAGAWLMLRGSKAPAHDPKAAAAAEAHGDHKAAAQYYKFDPPFVVNFGGTGNSRYLQVTVEAMSRDPLVVEAIKSNEPAIRNDLVLLFSGQQYDALVTAEGKEKLRQDTLAAIRKTVAGEGAKPDSVEGVYFTSFVIQ